MTLPIIGITMGDPAGVGPEVIVGAYNAGLSNLECHPIVIGNADRLRDAARIMGRDVQINTCMSVEKRITALMQQLFQVIFPMEKTHNWVVKLLFNASKGRRKWLLKMKYKPFARPH
jgi:4-hydroxy-L-threonine phosphate dehydrogenase PdxA